jgi:hypothetical protein
MSKDKIEGFVVGISAGILLAYLIKDSSYSALSESVSIGGGPPDRGLEPLIGRSQDVKDKMSS